MAKKSKAVSDPMDGVDVMAKRRPDSDPLPMGRHEKFQFGTNPMKMNSFEMELADREVYERERAARHYVHGIQGRDGGRCEYQQMPSYEEYP